MSNQLLEQMSNQGMWLSQDGNLVPVMDMDDQHLCHAYNIATNALREGYSVYVPVLMKEMQDRNLLVKFGAEVTAPDVPLNEINAVVEWCDRMLSQEGNNLRFERDMNELRNNLVQARRYA